MSFVGSTPVARAVYQRATHAGKRVQALGGAKNFVIVMPDADFEPRDREHHGVVLRLRRRALPGGQRARAGRARRIAEARDRLVESARSLKVGDGLEPGVQMGPVISGAHRDRVHAATSTRACTRARSCVLDGRGVKVAGRESGFFVGPTVFDEVSPPMTIGREEIFGPVASIHAVKDLDEAIALMELASERERHVDLHVERQGGARVRAPRDGVDGRRQHRRRRADGLLPVRRRARQLLRRPEGARPRRLRVLHRQEGHDYEVVLTTGTGVALGRVAGRRRYSLRCRAALISRVRDDPVAAQAAEVVERLPALVGVTLEKAARARQQPPGSRSGPIA